MTEEQPPMGLREGLGSSRAAESGSGARGGEGSEWAVKRDSYPPFSVLGPITKTTPQRIYFPATWGRDRESFTELENIIFRGDEEACRALAERLCTSKARMEEERQGAASRHALRVLKLIEDAAHNAGCLAMLRDRASAPPPPDPQVPGDKSRADLNDGHPEGEGR